MQFGGVGLEPSKCGCPVDSRLPPAGQRQLHNVPSPIIHFFHNTRLDTISSLVFLFMLECNPKWGVVPTFFVVSDLAVVRCRARSVNRVEIGDVHRSWNGNRLDNQYY
jgi:hypothetical protein